MVRFSTGAALSAAMILATGARAQSYTAPLDTKASSAAIDADASVDASGSLIGDYDPDTNPGGTQTRPGLFGGSGNQAIDTTIVLRTQTLLDARPTGSMTLTPDLGGGTIEIDGLMIDLLGGHSAETDLSVTLGFDTFHTVSPSFIYPGGIPITLPLGEVGRISVAQITQSDLGIGALTPTDDADVYTLTGVLSAQLDLTISLTLPGAEPVETPIEALPIVLPISGTLELVGPSGVRLTMVASPDPISTQVPIEGVDLPAIPFELPTLGSDTAGVLFTLSPSSLTFGASVELHIVALGQRQACPADFTGDGLLNFFDVSAFLGAYGAMDPSADLNGDGNWDFFDISAFLSAFAAGCP